MLRAGLLLISLVWTGSAFADAASDERDCANDDLSGAPRIESCTRLLDAGEVSTAVHIRLLNSRADAFADLETG